MAQALAPSDMLIVANSNSEASVQLAKLYAKLRGIPSRQILLLKTTTEYHCTRAEYESKIRGPVCDFLIQKKLTGKIRCAVLMWGVPVKIDWQAYWSAYPDVLAAYDTEVERAYCKVLFGEKLLDLVGKDFPAAPGVDFNKPEQFFSAPLPALSGAALPGYDAENIDTVNARTKLLRDVSNRMRSAIVTKNKNLPATLTNQQRALANDQIAAVCRLLFGISASDIIHPQIPPPTPAALTKPAVKASGPSPMFKEIATAEDKLQWSIMPVAEVHGLLATIEQWQGPMGVLNEYLEMFDPSGYRDAAVDSELSLLWHGHYPCNLWQQNLLNCHAGTLVKPVNAQLPKGIVWPAMLMTARIDGPTAADARRIIEDSVAVEKVGLQGMVYLDTIGKYPFYNVHYFALEKFISTNTKLKVVVNTKPPLFQPGSCPDAALYTGWYSLCNYIPAFTWNKGAVGFHLASFEAADLRDPNTKQWCAKMIQNGVAATLGPVSEPELQGFPLPEEFFSLLLTGKYTIAECFWRTVPHASWEMTLIADPLYNPYKVNPQVNVKLLAAGLAPE